MVKTAAILGATGMVGQRFAYLLHNHPWFELTTLAASERSAGKKYCECAKWYIEGNMPEKLADVDVVAVSDKIDADVIFSALPTEIAKDVEAKLVQKGKIIVSEASCFRTDADVPILIPEVNPEHIVLADDQKARWSGKIYKKPNCTTTGLMMALKPIQDTYGLKSVIVSTMQALSGAGYDGVPSMAIIDNVIPFIKNEDEKVEQETLKILGAPRNPANIRVSASCNRVATLEGHLECAFVETEQKADPEEVKKAMASFKSPIAGLELPTAPIKPLIVFEDPTRPQPRLDRYAGSPERARGMATCVGRVRKDNVFENGLRFTCLSHNTIRGAAGNSVLIAELLIKKGVI
ncbi:MAG: aspartate-semialdehyde dehydrogenase [Candidatus Micrarchaeota archaeon]